MDLYVVTTGLPGPGAAALLKMQPTFPNPDVRRGKALALVDAESAIEDVCEFVELETADGRGVGPASGIAWSEHPTSPGMYRLGPFVGPAGPLGPSTLTATPEEIDTYVARQTNDVGLCPLIVDAAAIGLPSADFPVVVYVPPERLHAICTARGSVRIGGRPTNVAGSR